MNKDGWNVGWKTLWLDKQDWKRARISLYILVMGLVLEKVVDWIFSVSIWEFIFLPIIDLMFITISIYLWVLLFIVALSVFLTYSYVKKDPIEKEEEQEDSTPKHEQYTSDKIFSNIWEWDWVAEEPYNLIPLCPNCSNQLDIKLSKYDSTIIFCNRNDFMDKHSFSPLEFRKRVIQEIERRVRTGEYIDILKNQNQ